MRGRVSCPTSLSSPATEISLMGTKATKLAYIAMTQTAHCLSHEAEIWGNIARSIGSYEYFRSDSVMNLCASCRQRRFVRRFREYFGMTVLLSLESSILSASNIFGSRPKPTTDRTLDRHGRARSVTKSLSYRSATE